MNSLFVLLFYQPLFNFLVGFYFLLGGDLGLATIVFTAFIRFLIWPWYQDIMRDQIVLAKLQPKIKEIQQKYHQEPQRVNKEILDFYRVNKINPFGMILFLVFQIILFLVLFRIFSQIFESRLLDWLYPWMPNPLHFNPLFLGFLPLNLPNLFLAVLAAVFQMFSGILSLKRTKTGGAAATHFNKIFIFLLPVIFIYLYDKFPAIIFLYWITISLVNTFQELIMKEKYIKV